MHSCLCIDEIVQNIFENVEETPTLGSLSLVCRAFLEPANDRLWSNLPGLAPLVKCLPDELVTTPDKSYKTVTILQPPQHAEWQRFQHHARHVTSLTVANEDEDEFAVDRGALRILAEHYPAPFFPRLVYLEWRNWYLAGFASMFIEPSIVTLEYIPSEMEPMRSVLSRVRTHAPRLQKLEFIDEIYDTLDELHDEFSQAILALNDLAVLRVEYASLQCDALLHASRLRHLTFLSLYLTAEIDGSWRSPHWGAFPALKRLSILPEHEDTGTASCASFLSALVGNSPLSRLELRLSRSLQDGDFKRLLSAIGRLTCLSSLSISYDHGPREWSASSIPGSVLLHLQPLSNMKNLIISGVPVSLEADQVRSLAAAWRDLERLTLVSSSTDRCHCHIEDLAFFAQHCRGLQRLSIQVHAVDDGWMHDGTIRVPLHMLSDLQLYAPSIAPAAEPAVALFLARSFPSVMISSHHPIVQHRSQLEAHEVSAMEAIERLEAETQRLRTGVLVHILEDRARAARQRFHDRQYLLDD